MVVSEIVKIQQSQAERFQLYYWRDKTGREIDLIIEKSNESISVEIKSGKTKSQIFFIIGFSRFSGLVFRDAKNRNPFNPFNPMTYIISCRRQESTTNKQVPIIGRFFPT